MHLHKLFGSRTKTDILKYLLFSREGISLRALESNIDRTFPAIKKQIDSLEEAEIINVDKSSNKWSITIEKKFGEYIQNLFLHALQKDILMITKKYSLHDNISQCYFGKLFRKDLPMDLVILYIDLSDKQIQNMKKEIGQACLSYFINGIAITCMSQQERDQRYRLADKFVLSIMKGISQ